MAVKDPARFRRFTFEAAFGAVCLITGGEFEDLLDPGMLCCLSHDLIPLIVQVLEMRAIFFADGQRDYTSMR